MRGWRTVTPAPRHLEQSAVTPARCQEADRVLPTGSPTAVEPFRDVAIPRYGRGPPLDLLCAGVAGLELGWGLSNPTAAHLDRWAANRRKRL